MDNNNMQQARTSFFTSISSRRGEKAIMHDGRTYSPFSLGVLFAICTTTSVQKAEIRPKSLISILLLFIYSFTLFFIFGRWLLFSVGKTVIITAANANTATAPQAP